MELLPNNIQKNSKWLNLLSFKYFYGEFNFQFEKKLIRKFSAQKLKYSVLESAQNDSNFVTLFCSLSDQDRLPFSLYLNLT
jgi:hypothetical protein